MYQQTDIQTTALMFIYFSYSLLFLFLTKNRYDILARHVWFATRNRSSFLNKVSRIQIQLQR